MLHWNAHKQTVNMNLISKEISVAKTLAGKIRWTLLICLSCILSVSVAQQLTPETALQGYIENGDKTFRWELKDSFKVGDVDAYNLLLTSQQWHEYVWTHQLTILVPRENKYDGALLFITGGSNKKGQPNWSKNEDAFLA